MIGWDHLLLVVSSIALLSQCAAPKRMEKRKSRRSSRPSKKVPVTSSTNSTSEAKPKKKKKLDSVSIEEEFDPKMQEIKHGFTIDQWRDYGLKTVEYIANYRDTVHERRVTPAVRPGFLKNEIPREPPRKPESFEKVLADFEDKIQPGIVHWLHPRFHAYFPSGGSYPSMIASMLCDMTSAVGFSWASCPSMTELEMHMLSWLGKIINLPEEFLPFTPGGKGGGVVLNSSSECILNAFLAARFDIIKKIRTKFPDRDEGVILPKLVAYCSKEASKSVERACFVGMVKLRILPTDDQHRLRGDTVKKAIEEDEKAGLIPFFVSTTLGTSSCVSFDDLSEIGPVCQANSLWLHVDCAYAGAAFVCPEFRHLMKGIDYAASVNLNVTKWLLVHVDHACMWVRDRVKLTQALIVDPVYLQHSNQSKAIDYRHWGIPLSRRFRSLKLWFVIRMYGVEGLQAYIREHVRLAKKMESLIRDDLRFEVVNEVLMGLVCFRLKGADDLTKTLLTRLNASGKIHMISAQLDGHVVIRFCVVAENTNDEDIESAYHIISKYAEHVLGKNKRISTDLSKMDKEASEKERRMQSGTDMNMVDLYGDDDF